MNSKIFLKLCASNRIEMKSNFRISICIWKRQNRTIYHTRKRNTEVSYIWSDELFPFFLYCGRLVTVSLYIHPNLKEKWNKKSIAFFSSYRKRLIRFDCYTNWLHNIFINRILFRTLISRIRMTIDHHQQQQAKFLLFMSEHVNSIINKNQTENKIAINQRAKSKMKCTDDDIGSDRIEWKYFIFLLQQCTVFWC